MYVARIYPYEKEDNHFFFVVVTFLNYLFLDKGREEREGEKKTHQFVVRSLMYSLIVSCMCPVQD